MRATLARQERLKQSEAVRSLQVRTSIEQIEPAAFAAFEASRRYPFLRREWLLALERSGVVSADAGWYPRHFVVFDGDRPIAFCPAYLKTHSMGEFVFDHAIAEFSEARLAVSYYPKLVVAVPFTPATGPRFLFIDGLSEESRGEAMALFAEGLPEFCREVGASSVHVLFPTSDEAQFLEKNGFSTRTGVQFQFHRGERHTFDDYLASFHAKRRAAIRRERREAGALASSVLSGESLRAMVRTCPDFGDRVYRLYLTTVDKFAWGRRYLNRAFFDEVLETMPDALHLVLAHRGDPVDPLAMAFNLLGADRLYGRYWGTFEEVPFLHFETCLYRGVEETILRRLDRFEPGAGGEHKESRGFSPTETLASSWFAHPVLARASRDYYAREAEAIRSAYPHLAAC